MDIRYGHQFAPLHTRINPLGYQAFLKELMSAVTREPNDLAIFSDKQITDAWFFASSRLFV
jgi:hypothetical protein